MTINKANARTMLIVSNNPAAERDKQKNMKIEPRKAYFFGKNILIKKKTDNVNKIINEVITKRSFGRTKKIIPRSQTSNNNGKKKFLFPKSALAFIEKLSYLFTY